MQKVEISKVKSNPRNPRVIRDNKFKKLVDSIKSFPEMLEKRPLVCETNSDGTYTVLGGNMRLKASKEVGLKEVPIILADDWTEEQKNEFLIKDNVSFGEWDWDMLANEHEPAILIDWGIDSYHFGSKEVVASILGEDDADEDEPMFKDEPSKEQAGSGDVKVQEPNKAPKITDTGYARFEIVIPEQDKIIIVDVLNKVKNKFNITSGEAFIKVFKSHKL